MEDSPVSLLALMSVKLVQPGLLSDVAEGFTRLDPSNLSAIDTKAKIKAQLDLMIERKLVFLYAHRRYMLTSAGEMVVESSGIREKMEARRLFLLKQTRKASVRSRSGTRDRSLYQ
jgi:hypothetical protein